ncbi:hypothetical protein SAMN05428949_6330 [Chitinophaga sp. YR627]|uniref:hypothetical protein n=1 Tax=Chitinophaga sp. YR627 TaxID=1881041 RepID=UPI0008E19C2A|nr:hypothetical protein [Chitinophaga sp. YR627]SFO72061.1 hypothetical protein SAMN05428949_6330 [Chitinophaga sp. YR627]
MSLLPYLLVPLLSAFFRPYTSALFTFLFTTALLFFYPQIYFFVEEKLHPRPIEEAFAGRCGMMEFSFMFSHWVLYMPAALILQVIFNKLFMRRKAAKEAAETINK